MDPEQGKFKVVNIQNLERKDQPAGRSMSDREISFKLDYVKDQYGEQKPQRRECYCFMDTGLSGRLHQGSNQFFMSFLIPYNQHGDVVLVPDNIWIAISLFLSKYIDDNAEKLRHFFVSHEGKKELVVVETALSVEESLELEKKWDYFFREIIKEVEKNTNEGVVEALACNFSTTNQLYQTISTAIIMNSFKKYFDYTRMICGCGINNVYFEGTRDDWVKLQTKLAKLAQYDVDMRLKTYVSRVSIILQKFLDTYDGKPDVDWWNRIVATVDGRGASGMIQHDFVEGWVLDFFGLEGKVKINKVPCFEVSVPIKLVNNLTQTVKNLELKADWVSVSKVNAFAYKPDIALCIFKNSESKLSN